MERRPLVISYYVEGRAGERQTHALLDSCKRFSLDVEIASIKDLGSPLANESHKPEFLLAALEKYNRPLIWVNIDSIIVEKPQILEECLADIALRINDNVAFDSPMKMVTSTLFINNTDSAKKLLLFWKKECDRVLQKEKAFVDQIALRKVIFHYPTMVEIKRLPATYVALADEKGNYPENSVIIHHLGAYLNEPAIV